MEKAVSKSIRDIIKLCEENNDFYSADWMTGAIMEEQLNGQRHLAGLINTLSGFRVSHEHLADWMFSNQLLNGAYWILILSEIHAEFYKLNPTLIRLPSNLITGSNN